jgi:monofunctional biosynthetic peptidoglycan transglycosylase
MAQVVILKYVNPPITLRIAFGWLQNLIPGSKPYAPPVYHWRNLKNISPYLRKAVLAAEDQRFLSHHGFDFIELTDALKDSLIKDRIRGASTITMQVARTVFLLPNRTCLRKVNEAYYTVLIELFWNKKRIFEIYLNTVDWGIGIMGAEAAARKYFNTNARLITDEEAALLAAILPNPHKFSPKNPSKYIRQRQNKILEDITKMPLL